MAQPTFDLVEFRLENDDGTTEANSTFAGTLNEDVGIPVGSSNIYRMRIQLYNSNAKAGSEVFSWEYRLGVGGTWTAITTTSSICRAIASGVSAIVDGADTSNRLTTRSGTFVTNNNGQCEDGVGVAYTHTSSYYSETFVVFYILDAGTSNDDKVYFRVVEGSGDTITILNDPIITVVKVILVAVNTLTLVSSHQTLTGVVGGPISVVLNDLTLASAYQTITVLNVPPARLVIVDELNFTGSPETFTDVVPGPVSILQDELTLAGSTPANAVAPGAVTTDPMNALTLTSAIQVLQDVVSGPVSIVIVEVTLSGSTPSLSVIPGSISVVFTEVTLTSSIPALTDVVGGPVSITMVDLVLVSAAVTMTVGGVEYPPVHFRFGRLHRARDPIHQLNI